MMELNFTPKYMMVINKTVYPENVFLQLTSKNILIVRVIKNKDIILRLEDPKLIYMGDVIQFVGFIKDEDDRYEHVKLTFWFCKDEIQEEPSCMIKKEGLSILKQIKDLLEDNLC